MAKVKVGLENHPHFQVLFGIFQLRSFAQYSLEDILWANFQRRNISHKCTSIISLKQSSMRSVEACLTSRFQEHSWNLSSLILSKDWSYELPLLSAPVYKLLLQALLEPIFFDSFKRLVLGVAFIECTCLTSCFYEHSRNLSSLILSKDWLQALPLLSACR